MPEDDLGRTLVPLAANLNCLAGIFEDYENVDEDDSWVGSGVDPIQNPPPRGAKYAIANVRRAMRIISKARDLADAVPAGDTMREVKETLTLAWNMIGQADVPAEYVMLNGHEEEAIACARDGIMRAWERCGGTLERLGAKVGVMADEALTTCIRNVQRATDPQSSATPEPSHSTDFTFVNWYGTEYTFALGVQSSAVKVLWDEWTKSGMGLHQDTIRNAIDAERDNFRMDTAFRNHPAFKTMIQRCGDGKYKLAPPTAGKAPPVPKAKKSAGLTSGARRRRV